MKDVGNGVFFVEQPLLSVAGHEIDFLKEVAKTNPSGKSRLCVHLSTDDTLHEMLIVHNKDCYVRPHRHFGKAESLHVLEGSADLITFELDGAVKDIIPIAPYPASFFYRIAEPVFHCLRFHSDPFVFHEATTGPFRREDSEFAPWSPPEPDKPAALRFGAWLRRVTKAGERFSG